MYDWFFDFVAEFGWLWALAAILGIIVGALSV